MNDLAQKECVPCKGGHPPLKGEPLRKLQQQLGDGWNVVQEHHLEKEYTFKNFRDALTFTNRVGELAESTNHHPDIYLAWGKVKTTLWRAMSLYLRERVAVDEPGGSRAPGSGGIEELGANNKPIFILPAKDEHGTVREKSSRMP